MVNNQDKLINNIKIAKNALDKYGEIGQDGFNYKNQLEFEIQLYEILTKKKFDRNQLNEF